MALFGRDRGRIETDQKRTLAHPIRFRIWSLFTTDPERPLAATALHANLINEWEFCDLSVSQVAYHLARLQDAQLIPTSSGG